jgi:signal transduction histidine kinase
MRRRLWPALLVVAAFLVFASYLVYTQYLVGKIREQAKINTQIWALVQQGLLSSSLGPGGPELEALVAIQAQIRLLQLPMILLDGDGNTMDAIDLPFEADPATPDGQRLISDYAKQIERRRPENVVAVEGRGTIIFGDPPLVAWLRWIPWLQVTGASIIVLVAFAVIRSDMRAERERLWAAMARELAHQMGTPLSSLSGWLEVLALPKSERDSLTSDTHMAEVMAADLERLERVSRRFELIGRPPALDTVDVGEIVHELSNYFVPRLPKIGKGIKLRARVENDVPPVRANRVLLAWALENVIKNAVDALAGRGGRIIIVAHRGEGGHVHVHIGDNGPGISPAFRERIFEPGVSTKSGGWGVGLSLTRRIVQELHGGRISVRARRSGGTVFDIGLPPGTA